MNGLDLSDCHDPRGKKKSALIYGQENIAHWEESE